MPRILACVCAVFFAFTASAQDLAPEGTEPPMTIPRLAEIILSLDPEALCIGRLFDLTIEVGPVSVVTDPAADRMRAMVPIRSAAGMSAEEVVRVMQANFDTALDARYAIANGRLWSVFIHPLSPLEKDQLISALGQTVNIALTYGSLYSGGALAFGGGDAGNLQRQLIDDLLKRGEDI